MKSGTKGKPDMYPSISPTESQEHIIDGGKTSVHVTTSRNRSGSVSGSDDVILQGITVTTDVKVVRD